MRKILYLITEDTYFVSHRLELALYAKQQGFNVAVATKCSKYYHDFISKGLQVFNLKFFNRSSFINPIKEILALKELYAIYKNFKPDIVHQVALKPIVYGTIIARILKVPKIINAIAGLGFVFTDTKYQKINTFIKYKILIKQKLLKIIIKNLFNIIFLYLFRSIDTLLLQNQDDLTTIKQLLKINNFQFNIKIIYGSGINMDSYIQVAALTEVDLQKNINIIMLSRLLWTKGVYEFVDAARIIKKHFNHTTNQTHINNTLKINPTFILYGDIDPKNPASISYTDLKLWQAEGSIIWKNFCQDVTTAYQDAHIVVLPSYREGLPKSLLEALACARAIVTTDVPGCKELVKHGHNGYLVPKENSLTLAEVLLNLIKSPKLIISMGQAGREIAIKQFSTEVILPQILNLYAL